MMESVYYQGAYARVQRLPQRRTWWKVCLMGSVTPGGNDHRVVMSVVVRWRWRAVREARRIIRSYARTFSTNVQCGEAFEVRLPINESDGNH